MTPMQSNEDADGGIRRLARSWDKHLGLIAGAATSLTVCLKLLAVAHWNPTTAFGILAANGTTNVLIGTLLAVLPVLYSYAYALFLPAVQRRIKKRTPVERRAAQMLETWPSVVLVFIVPAYLLAVTLVTLALRVFIPLAYRAVKKRRRKKKFGSPRAGRHEAPTRFEATSVALSGMIMLSYWTLATPWMPAEVANIEGVGPQTSYVLSKNDGVAIILKASDRQLQQIDAAALSGDFCQAGPLWVSAPVVALIGSPLYAPCPD